MEIGIHRLSAYPKLSGNVGHIDLFCCQILDLVVQLSSLLMKTLTLFALFASSSRYGRRASSGGASAADFWLKDWSRDCAARERSSASSPRDFCSIGRQRSATCLALGAPCLAPSANEPPRSRLMISTPGWESLHFLNVSASRSGSKSMGPRRSSKIMPVTFLVANIQESSHFR